MAAGEYTSVASQAEYTQAEIEIERREIRLHRRPEQAELAQMYIDKGVEPALARQVAKQIHSDLDQAVDVHSREEFGRRPGRIADADARRWFVVRLLRPSVRWSRCSRSCSVRARCCRRAVVILLALFGCGALVTRVTGRTWWYGGLRQPILGGAAAGITYLFGSLVGAGIG